MKGTTTGVIEPRSDFVGAPVFGPVQWAPYAPDEGTHARIWALISRRVVGYAADGAMARAVERLVRASEKQYLIDPSKRRALEKKIAWRAIASEMRRVEHEYPADPYEDEHFPSSDSTYSDSLLHSEQVAERLLRVRMMQHLRCFLREMHKTRVRSAQILKSQYEGIDSVWPAQLSAAMYNEAREALGVEYRSASYAGAWLRIYSELMWQRELPWSVVTIPLFGSADSIERQGSEICTKVRARVYGPLDTLLALLSLLLPSALLPRRAQAATPPNTSLGGARFAAPLKTALGVGVGLAVGGLLAFTFGAGAVAPEAAVTALAPTNLPAPGPNGLLHVVPGAPMPSAARPGAAVSEPPGAAKPSATGTQSSPTALASLHRATALASGGSDSAEPLGPDAGGAEANIPSPAPRASEPPLRARPQGLAPAAPAKAQIDVGADQTAALELSERVRLARKGGAHAEAVRLASQGAELPAAAARAAAASAVRTGDHAAALRLLDQASVTSTFGAAARDEAHLRAVALAALGQDGEARAARARLPPLARARAWVAGRLARATRER
jgi:hypothetical protein